MSEFMEFIKNCVLFLVLISPAVLVIYLIIAIVTEGHCSGELKEQKGYEIHAPRIDLFFTENYKMKDGCAHFDNQIICGSFAIEPTTRIRCVK